MAKSTSLSKLPHRLRQAANNTGLTALARGLADSIAPERCLTCLRVGTWLCNDCREQLNLTYPLTCVSCGKHETARGVVCPRCRKDTPLTGVLSAGSYHSPWAKHGVGWLKFKGVRSLAPLLANLMTPRLPAIAPLAQLQTEAVLIPIPLHTRRLRQRGFNQSADLAHALSQQTAIPADDELLVRQRSTITQTALPHSDRAANVRGAFAVTRELKPSERIIILVDDVTTTGSTLSAAALPLKTAGAAQVWGLTVARG